RRPRLAARQHLPSRPGLRGLEPHRVPGSRRDRPHPEPAARRRAGRAIRGVQAAGEAKRVMETVRVDKWLWAARFYKTRSLAQAACEGGKVDVNGQAAKPARALRAGDRIHLTMGEWRRELVVAALSERRGPAT